MKCRYWIAYHKDGFDSNTGKEEIMDAKEMIKNKIFVSHCIGYETSSERIEEIEIDCLEVGSINDVLPQLIEIAEFEKEHNIRCTLNRIKINRLND